MFWKKIFVVIKKYDVIAILVTKSIGKCGRNIFDIALPTDDYETIKIGLS